MRALALYTPIPSSPLVALGIDPREEMVAWGSEAFARKDLETAAPTVAGDPAAVRSWASSLRAAASPGSAFAMHEQWWVPDVRGVLPTVRAPTLILARPARRTSSSPLSSSKRSIGRSPTRPRSSCGYGDLLQPRPRGDAAEWFLVGLARQTRSYSVYVNAVEGGAYLLASYEGRLGKVKVGSASIGFADPGDLYQEVFADLLRRAHELSP